MNSFDHKMAFTMTTERISCNLCKYLSLSISIIDLTCVNGSCSELAPHLHTLCSMTLIANLLWATQDCVSQRSPSSDDKCECTLCRSNSKHSAASPKHPKGNLLPASGPLARALRSGSGHKAGSDDVCSC